MHSPHTAPLTAGETIGAIVIACSYITIFSLVKEPHRKSINALAIAGAGAVYWSGGLGVWEFVFGTAMMMLAYKGLSSYRYIAFGWLLHTGWDVMHHLYGKPVVYLDPASSVGCAVCDPILAAWFFLGAPSIFNFIQKTKTA